ncbi:MAG: DUF3619 family protein [Pseudomonadota bacterium]|nr:hypothetical protein [Pseudomonadales bacterium]MDY6920185.1 DUF3619 family protein [Pseudomonadota bacterium]
MSEAHDKLARTLAKTLDQSLEQLDQDTLQQLRAAREQAQATRRRLWRPALASAAALVLLVSGSWFLSQQQHPGGQQPSLADSYLSEDPQMLADWEMLAAIGESPDA